MAFPTTQNNVQSLHLNQSSLKLNFKYNSEDIHVKYASKRTTTNRGTYLRPRVQMSAPRQQPDQQTRQLPLQLGGRLKGQSNVFKTPQVNLWKPVQRQPCVAEESHDLSLYRKRKREILDFLGESSDQQTRQLPLQLDGYESIVEPMECMTTHHNASLVNYDMVLAFENTKTQTTSPESKNTEAQSACFDDNSSGSGSKNMKIPSVSLVDCDMVSKSEKIKAQVACLDDNSSVSVSENLKIPSVSSADCDMVSESKKTKVQVACSEDKSSGSGSGNKKIPSVSLADFLTAS
ncbi:hypothetical protein Tco_0529347 [Tanacetum coccineum]